MSYRKYRRSTIKSGVSFYASNFDHWRTIQQTVTHPGSNRHYGQHAIRGDLEWLRRKEAGIIASGSAEYGRVFYAQSG